MNTVVAAMLTRAGRPPVGAAHTPAPRVVENDDLTRRPLVTSEATTAPQQQLDTRAVETPSAAHSTPAAPGRLSALLQQQDNIEPPALSEHLRPKATSPVPQQQVALTTAMRSTPTATRTSAAEEKTARPAPDRPAPSRKPSPAAHNPAALGVPARPPAGPRRDPTAPGPDRGEPLLVAVDPADQVPAARLQVIQPPATLAASAPSQAEPVPTVVIDTIRVEVAAPPGPASDPFAGLRRHAGGITAGGRR